MNKGIIYDVQTLLQTLEMYEKTRNEVLALNRDTSVIDNEMDNIRERIAHLMTLDKNAISDDAKNEIKCKPSSMTQEFMDSILKVGNEKRVEKYDMNGSLPNSFNPLKINHFVVRFPKEFGIKPYMIDGVWFNGDSIIVNIRESEGEYPILPLKLKDMTNSKSFKLYIDILNSDGSIYYTVEYSCNQVKNEGIPYLSYNDDGIRNWQIYITYDKEEYLTALPNVYPNETAD